MRFSKREIIGSALITSTLLMGCSDGRVVVDEGQPCQAIDIYGNVIEPTGYPEGAVHVEYQEARTVYNSVESVEGEITRKNGNYVLLLSALPEVLANGYIEDFNKTDAVVIISDPDFGRVGLTPNCIIRETNQYGVPSVSVQLPTK